MTREDLIASLFVYCLSTECKFCKLNDANYQWKIKMNYNDCLSFNLSEIDDLQKAYDIIHGKKVNKNDYWSNICQMQKEQTEKGIKKYGQQLEDNTELTTLEKLRMIQEELIDALMYIEHLKNGGVK